MIKTTFGASLMDSYQLARRSGFSNTAQAFSEMLLDEELGPELQKAGSRNRQTQFVRGEITL